MLQNIVVGVVIAAAVILSLVYLFRLFRGAVKGESNCNCEEPGREKKKRGKNDGKSMK